MLGILIGAKAKSNFRALNQTIITKIQSVFMESEPIIKYVDRIVEVPVIKYVSSSQRKPSLGEVVFFLGEDKTNEDKNLSEKDYASILKENANERGIRCGTVRLDCTDKDGELATHVLNAFDIEDDGALFVYAKYDAVMRNITVGADYGYLISIAEGKEPRYSGVIIKHINFIW
jgi:hypothetical protein